MYTWWCCMWTGVYFEEHVGDGVMALALVFWIYSYESLWMTVIDGILRTEVYLEEKVSFDRYWLCEV